MRGAVLVCGLNGAGKSTLGRALAERLGVPFLDSEDLFFPKNDPEKPWDSPRSPQEAQKLLLREISRSPDLVFAAVRCDFGPEVLDCFRWAVLVEAPRQLRLERVRERSYRRFGERMRPGGDLHQGEEAFFRMVEERPETLVEEWLRAANLPVVRVDGTRPPAENAAWLARQMQG
ncbi:MAG TPA: AAA family ATPase [Candidatus Acutalibacter stercorigallinarum]|nr:AAA family ATPase [Candidatus Acutalibacter stercorigallinarum]